MTDSKLQEWFNRAMQVVLSADIRRNEYPTNDSHITIRFDQADIDEYLHFADYIEDNYKDYERVVEVNKTAENTVELKFYFNGDEVFEFCKDDVKCENIRIDDWFKRPKNQKFKLSAVLNSRTNELLLLSQLDPDNKAGRSIEMHRWYSKPSGTS